MDEELKRIRDDLLLVMVKLKDHANAKDRIEKAHIAQVLAMLAGAIQEDALESLAQAITDWGKVHLKKWKTTGK